MIAITWALVCGCEVTVSPLVKLMVTITDSYISLHLYSVAACESSIVYFVRSSDQRILYISSDYLQAASEITNALYFDRLALNFPPYTWTQYPLPRAFLGLSTDACITSHIYLYVHLCICRGLYHDLLTRRNLTLDLSAWHKHHGLYVRHDLWHIHLIRIGRVHILCARRALVDISCH